MRNLTLVCLSCFFAGGCAGNVSVGDMRSIGMPSDSLEQFYGTFHVNRNPADFHAPWLPELSYHADAVQIVSATASDITFTTWQEGRVLQTFSVPAIFDHGYLFFHLSQKTWSTFNLAVFYGDTATGMGIDPHGDLFWKSDQRSTIMYLLIIPYLSVHFRFQGKAERMIQTSEASRSP